VEGYSLGEEGKGRSLHMVGTPSVVYLGEEQMGEGGHPWWFPTKKVVPLPSAVFEGDHHKRGRAVQRRC